MYCVPMGVGCNGSQAVYDCVSIYEICKDGGPQGVIVAWFRIPVQQDAHLEMVSQNGLKNL